MELQNHRGFTYSTTRCIFMCGLLQILWFSNSQRIMKFMHLLLQNILCLILNTFQVINFINIDYWVKQNIRIFLNLIWANILSSLLIFFYISLSFFRNSNIFINFKCINSFVLNSYILWNFKFHLSCSKQFDERTNWLMWKKSGWHNRIFINLSFVLFFILVILYFDIRKLDIFFFVSLSYYRSTVWQKWKQRELVGKGYRWKL